MEKYEIKYTLMSCQNILQLLGDMMTPELIWLAVDSKWIDNTKTKCLYIMWAN